MTWQPTWRFNFEFFLFYLKLWNSITCKRGDSFNLHKVLSNIHHQKATEIINVQKWNGNIKGTETTIKQYRDGKQKQNTEKYEFQWRAPAETRDGGLNEMK